ncbi:hypothetical protein BC835DRAFT_1305164 [Cytidiella melzeri]|nr:hypothetical protein BC835DRAFT_1305164 [Cytidiella melzeri]
MQLRNEYVGGGPKGRQTCEEDHLTKLAWGIRLSPRTPGKRGRKKGGGEGGGTLAKLALGEEDRGEVKRSAVLPDCCTCDVNRGETCCLQGMLGVLVRRWSRSKPGERRGGGKKSTSGVLSSEKQEGSGQCGVSSRRGPHDPAVGEGSEETPDQIRWFETNLLWVSDPHCISDAYSLALCQDLKNCPRTQTHGVPLPGPNNRTYHNLRSPSGRRLPASTGGRLWPCLQRIVVEDRGPDRGQGGDGRQAGLVLGRGLAPVGSSGDKGSAIEPQEDRADAPVVGGGWAGLRECGKINWEARKGRAAKLVSVPSEGEWVIEETKGRNLGPARRRLRVTTTSVITRRVLANNDPERLGRREGTELRNGEGKQGRVGVKDRAWDQRASCPLAGDVAVRGRATTSPQPPVLRASHRPRSGVGSCLASPRSYIYVLVAGPIASGL